MTDKEATKAKIERVLGDELRRSVKSNDRVFIFFAGHGQTESLPEGGQEGYLIPVDGDGDHLFSTCISMTTVRGFSDRLEAKHVFYAIDACYSGMALTRSGSMRGGDRLYLDRVARFRARQIVTAGRAGEQVVERGGHGIFTLAILMALDGNADKYAPFGILTGTELGTYLTSTVGTESRAAQTPQFGRLSAGEGEFLFYLPGYVPDERPESKAKDGRASLGHLKVNVTVPGSEVFVDGRSRGTANPGEPLDIPDAGLGLVAVKVVADGHETLEREYDLQPGTWTMIELAPQSNIERREDFGISQWEDIVEVDEFFIHQHEVTNTQFAAFLNARGNQREGGQPWIRLDDRSGIQKTNNGFEVKMLHDPHPLSR